MDEHESAEESGNDDYMMPQTNPGTNTSASPLAPSEEDSLEWRREYNIRLREEKWRKHQDELIKQKRAEWEFSRMETLNRITAAREAQFQRMLEQRTSTENNQVDREYRERCREAKIEKRKKCWEERVAAEIVGSLKDGKEKEAERSAAKEATTIARQVERAKLADEKQEALRLAKERQMKRDSNIAKREAAREQRGAENACELKKSIATEVAKGVNESSRPKWSRCVLVSEVRELSRREVMRDERREATLNRREKERNQKEAMRARSCKEREEKEGLLLHFNSPTERALLLGQRSIFQ